MSPPATEKPGKLSWTDSFVLVVTLIALPAVLLWTALSTSFASYNKDRSLKRILADRTLRYALSHSDSSQVQAILGTTSDVYGKFTKQLGLPAIVDELEDYARVLRIGPKRLDRLVMFLSMASGGYHLSVAQFALSFWQHVQIELEKQNIDSARYLTIGSSRTISDLPTPLNQARLVLQFAAGVQPQNLQIAGDSAGGNLVLQLLSHALHPCQGVPELRLAAPLRATLLISPGVSLSANSKSHRENDGIDFLTKKVLANWGKQVLSRFPKVDATFSEPMNASDSWFVGAERFVERVLSRPVERSACAELVVQKGGLHEDMLLDFNAKETNLGSLTPLIIEWMAAGFK
ncbi:hypothetical protein DFH06DRAFT_1339433 [Mycena polygramma]|nr:hypothetical protein DFH06DRAFT_1339433 [Mycena polygramma]